MGVTKCSGRVLIALITFLFIAFFTSATAVEKVIVDSVT